MVIGGSGGSMIISSVVQVPSFHLIALNQIPISNLSNYSSLSVWISIHLYNKAMLNVIAFGRDISAAIYEPRLHNQLIPNTTSIERGYNPQAIQKLSDVGNIVRIFIYIFCYLSIYYLSLPDCLVLVLLPPSSSSSSF